MSGPGRYWQRLKDGARDFIRHVDLKAIGNDVERHTVFANCERPVLLLPGFMATRRGLSVLERRLRREGYGVFSLHLGGLLDTFNTRSIEETGFLVHEKVEALYQRHPNMGPLTIIGHSKGGLIGRYYVKRLGGRERVRALITLGTPHHGTPNAYVGALAMGIFARSVWQLTPMSPFIRRLKRGPFPHHIHFTSIYSRDDNMVPFPSGMIEDRGRLNLRNIEIPGLSHHEFLLRASVFETILAEMEEAFAPPAALAGESGQKEGERPVLKLVQNFSEGPSRAVSQDHSSASHGEGDEPAAALSSQEVSPAAS